MTINQNNSDGRTGPTVTINLDESIRLDIPLPDAPLRARRFTGKGTQGGWSLQIPGQRPIATPAYEDGLLFVGGGYGSYAFYALDAITGEIVWDIKTVDDGPTAAVVERGYVAFNTESCTVIVCEARSGKVAWQEWLGDPLMSQPAIRDDRLFIAYPGGWQKPMFRDAMSYEEKQQAISAAKSEGLRGSHSHLLLCADLRTGKHLWEQEITSDVMTAPVVDDEHVFVTCFDGTSFCLKVTDGSVVWKKEDQATSAPLVVDDHVISTEKTSSGRRVFQRHRRSMRGTGVARDDQHVYFKEASYLSEQTSGGSSLRGLHAQNLDSSVGFNQSPASAKLHAASAHTGVSSVASAWAYQGSRSAYVKGRMFNNHGRYVSCMLDEDEGLAWEAEAKGTRVDPDDQIFLPPALGQEYVYLASMLGHVVSTHQETGQVGMMYDVQRPIGFQPCLAKGRIHFGTNNGELICIDTGNADADGWYMWGGNAQHNKVK